MNIRRFIGRRKRLCFKKSKKYGKIISVVILSALVLMSFLCAIFASIYALKNEKVDGKSIKCLKYN